MQSAAAQIGLENSTTLFADGDDALSGDVTGSVQAQAGGGQESTISATADGVVIDAVVVKGGNGYNVYLPTSNVFPAYPGPYMAPLNGGGNVPAFSHWFVCYHNGDVAPPPPAATGSLIVQKLIVNPSAVVLSADYTVHVTCDDGTDTTRTLPSAGGSAIDGPVTGIAADSLCNVTETSTAGATAYLQPCDRWPDRNRRERRLRSGSDRHGDQHVRSGGSRRHSAGAGDQCGPDASARSRSRSEASWSRRRARPPSLLRR